MGKIIIINQKKEWELTLGLLKIDDIYLSYDYTNLFLKEGESQHLLVWSENSNYILIPVVKRPIIHSELTHKHYYDLTSVYGYGGPYFIGEINQEMIDSFVSQRDSLFKELCIVSEFVRINPLFLNISLTEKLYKLHKIGKTIFINTDHKSDEDLLIQVASNCRYSVKKAIRFNLVFRELALNKENLSIFKTLYDATMKRDNASNFYFFDDSFYFKLLKFDPKNLRLFMILNDNQPISCALVLVKNYTAHYFLSGSDLAYLNLSPNNFLLFSISAELAKEGIKVFHLGGGVGGLEDGLYKFKKSFNPSGELDFYLGTKIYNKDLYNHLSTNLSSDGKFFFPLYRK